MLPPRASTQGRLRRRPRKRWRRRSPGSAGVPPASFVSTLTLLGLGTATTLAVLRYNNTSRERLLTDRRRILAKRTNFGIPNEINAVRSLRVTGKDSWRPGSPDGARRNPGWADP